MVKRISIFSSFACFTRVRRAWKERTRRSKHNKKILWKYLEEGKRTQTFNIPQMRSAKLRNNQFMVILTYIFLVPFRRSLQRVYFLDRNIFSYYTLTHHM